MDPLYAPVESSVGDLLAAPVEGLFVDPVDAPVEGSVGDLVAA